MACDTFSLPFFHTPIPVFSSCSQYAFYLVFVYASLTFSAGVFCTTHLPLSSGTTTLFNWPCEVGKLMSKTQRVSIAIPGTVHIVSTMWEVGSVISCLHISCIPRAGKHLPMAYNFASLQAINARSLVSFLHTKTKNMLWAAGCFSSNMKHGFWG